VPTYYTCANLCGAVRAGIAHAIAGSGLDPKADFAVLLVSFDPRDSSATANAAQREDADSQPGAGVEHWNYLTGTAEAIRALMHSIGFRYLFDPRDGQYAHGAGAVVLSPQGTVTQYLFGVRFPSQTLRLALVDAAQGRIGNIVDQFMLFCSRYDASTGRYDLAINRVMMGLGISTTLALAVLILVLRRMEFKRTNERAGA
jgi:protein SCO1/2